MAWCLPSCIQQCVPALPLCARPTYHQATGKHKGKSYQLYNFGWDSWENIVCRPFTSRKTVCIGLDDGGIPHQGVSALGLPVLGLGHLGHIQRPEAGAKAEVEKSTACRVELQGPRALGLRQCS
jgi:hypothetical protein